MNIHDNTILITGGGSGIGQGLAEALAKEGNKVIISGRREDKINQIASSNPNITAMALDVQDKESIKSFAQKLIQEYPDLNVIINNAGIMRPEFIKKQNFLDDAEETIITNLLGPIRLIDAFMPHLLKQPKAAILNVTSGLAFVPLAITPTYSATKAALHSYSQSLRFQLSDTNVEVVEIVPPQVQTELMGKPSTTGMPLDEYIAEVIQILKSSPDQNEICVERVKMLREAESKGSFDEAFKMVNQRSVEALNNAKNGM